ncbi:ABC transporter ATP-binding protein [Schleiferilactobacillus shenzhenensis]|uniref:MsbA n=1 Tax=Schleiferilactobacillus shenzhenensis LY-73 TaxID=1231336 RepID=U4TI73_9LACO|nr:ABC transporter ATP-binding protein [Schleiferilactobacillus shenzhenensis]ERL64501.1 MsbA [Schleiferilactobacillus shenzhenensis LY-73]
MEKMTEKHFSIWQNLPWFKVQRHGFADAVRWWLPAIVVIQLGVTLISAAVPALLVRLLGARTGLPTLLVAMIGIGLGLGCLQFGQVVVDAFMQQKSVSVRLEMFTKDGADYLHIPFTAAADAQVRAKRAESMTYGYGGDTSGVGVFYGALVHTVQNAFLILVDALILGGASWWISAAIVATTVLAFYPQQSFQRFRRAKQKTMEDQWNPRSYVQHSSFQEENGKDIRLYHMADWYQQKYEHFVDLDTVANRSIERRRFWVRSLSALLTLVRNGVGYGLLVFLAVNQHISLSQFTFYFTLLTTVGTTGEAVLTQYGLLRGANADINTGRRFLDWADDVIKAMPQGKTTPNFGTAPLTVVFDHVTFTYPDGAAPVLNDISFTLHGGERVALVGLNGAGKTTITMLMMGLLTPDKGTITINGVDIQTISPAALRHYFAPVFQESTVFAGTVGYNVAMTHDYDPAKVKAAIAEADLTDAIAALPHGIKTELTTYLHDDGVTLSGGQTQKLMIARALYRDAPILLLDEPTAALDALAESALYQHYQKMATGKTSLFISHRLASTRFSDRILFIQHGQIAASGSHDELLAKSPEYAELYHTQSQYYDEDQSSEEAAQDA